MSAERMPQPDDSLLVAPLQAITRAVLRAPRLVLGMAAALALASILLSVRDMGFHTSRLDLLNPESDYNQLWLEYLEEFGEGDDAVVVVRGPNRDVVIEAIDTLAEAISQDERHFHSVLHEIDLSVVRAKGLYYLPLEDLRRLEHSLDEIQPLLDGEWSQVKLDHQLRMAAQAANGPATPAREQAAAAHLERLSKTLVTSFETTDSPDTSAAPYISPWAIADAPFDGIQDRLDELDTGSGRMLTRDGRMGFILLRLSHDDGQKLDPASRSIARLRDLISESQDQHSNVEIGLTGLPVMENDEMQASQKDMLRASGVSLLGVACLFMAGLGGVRHPLLTVAALLLAMAWTFGYITLAVGHLNILSVSFGVILIGLGIDFGIHYVARYMQLRGERNETSQAIVATAGSVGPGVFVGAITTAIAFFAACFTEFTGVAELGMIAGGGILLCLLATLVVLPALIYLADYRSTASAPPRPLRMDRFLDPLLKYPMATLFLGVLATGVLSAGIGRLSYDHNLLNLQPHGMESVELERMLLEESEHSVWYAVSMSPSRDDLLARKEQFEQLPHVERTEEILSLLPADPAGKTPIIARIRKRLANLPQESPLIPLASSDEIRRDIAAAGVSLSGDDPQVRQTQMRLSEVGDRLVRMSNGDVLEHVSSLQQKMAADLLSQLRSLREISQPEPPALGDLPPSLVERFVGKKEQHLLKVYGRGDIWDVDALGAFVDDVKEVDPRATGQPLQTFYASHQMQQSYINAALYALAAIVVVLLIEFRKLSLTFLALVPVGAGIVQMFGLMGLLGIPLNPANMIVLPLILGIGLDDGVHVVHDFRRRRGKYRVSTSTTAAVVVTSLTTMVGFGSLMLASHQGLQSLGRVLTIGVTCCLFSSLVLLPALLRWMSEGDLSPDVSGDLPASPAIEIAGEEAATMDSTVGSAPRRRAA